MVLVEVLVPFPQSFRFRADSIQLDSNSVSCFFLSLLRFFALYEVVVLVLRRFVVVVDVCGSVC